MKLRTLAPLLLAGLLLTGCVGHMKINSGARPITYDLRVPKPSHLIASVDGEPRVTLKSSVAGILKGKPGTCLLAGADGVFAPCP